jgi:ribosomal protein S18 acetylase RimI-like enzyme
VTTPEHDAGVKEGPAASDPLVVIERANAREALALAPLAARTMAEHRYHRWRHGTGRRARLAALVICLCEAAITVVGGGLVLTDPQRRGVVYATPRRLSFHVRVAAAVIAVAAGGLVAALVDAGVGVALVAAVVVLAFGVLGCLLGRVSAMRTAVHVDTALGRARRSVHGPYWSLALLAVDDGQRDKGLGSALVRALQRRVGPPILVRAGEQRAASLYGRLGFVEELGAADLPTGIRTSLLLWSPVRARRRGTCVDSRPSL